MKLVQTTASAAVLLLASLGCAFAEDTPITPIHPRLRHRSPVPGDAYDGRTGSGERDGHDEYDEHVSQAGVAPLMVMMGPNGTAQEATIVLSKCRDGGRKGETQTLAWRSAARDSLIARWSH
jgi:hypothetical protein